MAKTDLLLKQLIMTCSHDFAEWLLKTKVQTVSPCASELPPPVAVLRADQVFQVTTATGAEVVLHIEFQARKSHKPMPQRQLAYIIRLAEEHQLPLRSVVFYIGPGAGKGDTGQHSYPRDDGQAIVSWSYDVIHLWEMTAEELLRIGKLGLLGLLGQTKITNPTVTIPAVIAQIRGVADAELRGKLLELFAALITDKELLAMFEKFFIAEELLVDTPYMQRLQEIRQEGIQEGLGKGRQEGIQEGLGKGRQEATLTTRQQDILEVLQFRFGPDDLVLAQLKTALAKVFSETMLHTLFHIALRAETLAAFQTELAQQQAQSQN